MTTPTKNVAAMTVLEDNCENVYVFCGSDEATRQAEIKRTAEKALKKGHTVIYETGVRVHHERVVRFNPKADTSSARYEWSEDGNKVRADIVEHTIHPDGTEDTRTVREVWVKY